METLLPQIRQSLARVQKRLVDFQYKACCLPFGAILASLLLIISLFTTHWQTGTASWSVKVNRPRNNPPDTGSSEFKLVEMRSHSGLWEICCDEMACIGQCRILDYLSAQSENRASGTSLRIIETLRKTCAFHIASTILTVVATSTYFVVNARVPIESCCFLPLGISFVFSGLSGILGVYIFIASNDNLSEGNSFSYEYSWSFYFASLSALLNEILGVVLIKKVIDKEQQSESPSDEDCSREVSPIARRKSLALPPNISLRRSFSRRHSENPDLFMKLPFGSTSRPNKLHHLKESFANNSNMTEDGQQARSFYDKNKFTSPPYKSTKKCRIATSSAQNLERRLNIISDDVSPYSVNKEQPYYIDATTTLPGSLTSVGFSNLDISDFKLANKLDAEQSGYIGCEDECNYNPVYSTFLKNRSPKKWHIPSFESGIIDMTSSPLHPSHASHQDILLRSLEGEATNIPKGLMAPPEFRCDATTTEWSHTMPAGEFTHQQEQENEIMLLQHPTEVSPIKRSPWAHTAPLNSSSLISLLTTSYVDTCEKRKLQAPTDDAKCFQHSTNLTSREKQKLFSLKLNSGFQPYTSTQSLEQETEIKKYATHRPMLSQSRYSATESDHISVERELVRPNVLQKSRGFDEGYFSTYKAKDGVDRSQRRDSPNILRYHDDSTSSLSGRLRLSTTTSNTEEMKRSRNNRPRCSKAGQ